MPSAYETVLQQANIIDILKAYGISVNGNKCICPFHNDKNPSMHVDTRRNIVKCFSCGEGGNAITFIKKYENKVNHNSSFGIDDAIKKAAEICNIQVDLSSIKKSENREVQYYDDEQKSLLEDNKYFEKLFNYNLTATADGSECLEYLNQRGISQEIISKMKLGFSAEKNFSGNIIEKAKNVSLTDTRMRNRLMIPIYDAYGNVVGFSGRTIKNEEPKYLLIPETKVFHKSEILFNLNNAKNVAYKKEIILVEGFMDVIGAEKMGLHNVVATMGTAITEQHKTLLKKLRCEVILALDNDEAGKNAILKNIPILLKENFKVSVIDISKLGDYKDFGDVGNTNITAEEVLSKKESWLEYLIENQYLKSKSVAGIKDAYDSLKKDGFKMDSLNDEIFIETIQRLKENSTRESIINTIHPIEVKARYDRWTMMSDKLMSEAFYEKIDEYVNEINGYRAEKIYTLKHKQKVYDQCKAEFDKDPNKYLKMFFIEVVFDFEELIPKVLANDVDFQKFKEQQYFPSEEALKHVKIFNEKNLVSGGTTVYLSDEQKSKLAMYYNKSEDKKNNYEDAEELWIIGGSRTDLQKIFPKSSDSMINDVLSAMVNSMSNGNFIVLSYNLFFNQDLLPVIDDKYKNKDKTDFKKVIVFFDLRFEKLKITKENLVNKSSKDNERIIMDKNDIVDMNSQDVVLASNKGGYYILKKKWLEKLSDNSYTFKKIKGIDEWQYFRHYEVNGQRLKEKVTVADIKQDIKQRHMEHPIEHYDIDKDTKPIDFQMEFN